MNLNNIIEICVSGENVERFLNLCSFHDIKLSNITNIDNKYYMNLSSEDFFKLKSIIKKSNVKVKITKKKGFLFQIKKQAKRKLFFITPFLCLLLLWISSHLLWGIRIEGNSAVTDDLIEEFLKEQGIFKVDGIVLDLGVSSYQLDTIERGFSYNHDARLDMRMDRSFGLSAYDVVNTYSKEQLTSIFRDYGEEKFASSIAQKIMQAREIKPVETTFELVELIKAGIPARARREGGHPAKRTFQAIRIEVNDELNSLKKAVGDFFDLLNPNGRLAITTFHSLEVRIVKTAFASYCKGCTCPPDFPICVCGNKPKGKLVFKKPVVAGREELEQNSRSSCAKLRAIEKL